jgi:hypothetical protein
LSNVSICCRRTWKVLEKRQAFQESNFLVLSYNHLLYQSSNTKIYVQNVPPKGVRGRNNENGKCIHKFPSQGQPDAILSHHSSHMSTRDPSPRFTVSTVKLVCYGQSKQECKADHQNQVARYSTEQWYHPRRKQPRTPR